MRTFPKNGANKGDEEFGRRDVARLRLTQAGAVLFESAIPPSSFISRIGPASWSSSCKPSSMAAIGDLLDQFIPCPSRTGHTNSLSTGRWAMSNLFWLEYKIEAGTGVGSLATPVKY